MLERLTEMMRSGRADTRKEAIFVLDTVVSREQKETAERKYREKMLQLEKARLQQQAASRATLRILDQQQEAHQAVVTVMERQSQKQQQVAAEAKDMAAKLHGELDDIKKSL